MTEKIENSKAFKSLQQFQKDLVIKRDNRLKIEDAVIIARNIGVDNWKRGTSLSKKWHAIVEEII